MLEKLILFVEEYSMEAALEILLPEIIGEIEFQIIRFQCKDDLLKQLPARLKGYSSWLPEEWMIFVLVDRDDDDCVGLKQKLETHALTSGFVTKTQVHSTQRFQVINRIVIEELEAWYFGDWKAVQTAYPRVNATIPKKAPFRDPDAIAGGTWEALERILKKAGYFSTGLRKLDLARQVARHMTPERNRSHSFRMFFEALTTALAWEL